MFVNGDDDMLCEGDQQAPALAYQLSAEIILLDQRESFAAQAHNRLLQPVAAVWVRKDRRHIMHPLANTTTHNRTGVF
jgi:hypothetical protein